MFRGRFDGVAHDLTSLGFIDYGLPVQRAGEMGLSGEILLRLEVIKALLDESAGGARSLVRAELTGKSSGCLTGLLCSLLISVGAGRA